MRTGTQRTRMTGWMAAAVMLGSAAPVRADVVLDWNATMMQTITGLSPFGTQRLTAITQLAVFEAVNAVTGGYEPYLNTITAPAGASPEAAAAAAAHGVLTFYYPAKAGALDAALALSLAAIPDGPAEDDGVAVGAAAAAAMIAARSNDGSSPSASYPPAPAAPGVWQPTPSCTTGLGGNLHWGRVTPFGVPDVTAFRAAPPPKIASGEYAKDYLEVMTVGAENSVRPVDRTEVAFFYGQGLSPVAWANWTARQVAAAQGRSLAENARALALLNMALNDASVAVFESKYFHDFWRPETGIKTGADDGAHLTDGDVTFKPLITAPCFPGYPSNHGTASAAAAEVLDRLYGSSGHDITLTVASQPGVVLHYTTFSAIVEDVHDARVYGGIHFRFDQIAGEKQGRRIAEYIIRNRLRAVHPF
jgi:hypothetical protein